MVWLILFVSATYVVYALKLVSTSHTAAAACGGEDLFSNRHPQTVRLAEPTAGNLFSRKCIQRYPGLYGSDDRMQACMAELGVPLTKELGFHQMVVRRRWREMVVRRRWREMVARRQWREMVRRRWREMVVRRRWREMVVRRR
ncbi:PREDICTED: uncharacterized protein LOC105960340 [Erythranthe guttata]|uniref:uncharacterized protein LOC105960340 n=1 Tax=Erythranthe guttata TaxID=4155 RepID=UPI00064DCBFE|nr:PREDICTED: uncharacterized protein LOC105960340 [Erythranthe guttata]|eukprot:XP_012839954.1 PREDICTED: uncharacterized protein LOC105960340 [Erythranthe guttata]